MESHDLTSIASARASELPDAVCEQPFGPQWDVFTVRGKIFVLLTEIVGHPIVILKAAPPDGEALRSSHDDITPGYHMNKRHWITLHPGGALDRAEVEELVVESYRLVVAGLPRSRRPTLPDEL